VEGVIYGLQTISERNRIITSRRMVAVLGWKRRRLYDEMLDSLDDVRRFESKVTPEIYELLTAIKLLATRLIVLNPDVEQYFEGLFWGSPKAWALSFAIQLRSGLDPDQETTAETLSRPDGPPID
jgi:hypothetical protein